jgi:hypothetical protein
LIAAGFAFANPAVFLSRKNGLLPLAVALARGFDLTGQSIFYMQFTRPAGQSCRQLNPFAFHRSIFPVIPSNPV